MWITDVCCVGHGCFCIGVCFGSLITPTPQIHTHNPAHMFRFTDYPLHAPTHLPLLTFCLTLFTCSGSLTTLPTHLPPAHLFSHPAHMFRFTDYPPHSLPPAHMFWFTDHPSTLLHPCSPFLQPCVQLVTAHWWPCLHSAMTVPSDAGSVSPQCSQMPCQVWTDPSCKTHPYELTRPSHHIRVTLPTQHITSVWTHPPNALICVNHPPNTPHLCELTHPTHHICVNSPTQHTTYVWTYSPNTSHLHELTHTKYHICVNSPTQHHICVNSPIQHTASVWTHPSNTPQVYELTHPTPQVCKLTHPTHHKCVNSPTQHKCVNLPTHHTTSELTHTPQVRELTHTPHHKCVNLPNKTQLREDKNNCTNSPAPKTKLCEQTHSNKYKFNHHSLQILSSSSPFLWSSHCAHTDYTSYSITSSSPFLWSSHCAHTDYTSYSITSSSPFLWSSHCVHTGTSWQKQIS